MLYHKDVYWESYFDEKALSLVNDRYSEHLLECLLFAPNKQHAINTHTLNRIIDNIKNKNIRYNIYEVETDKFGNVVKAVFRTSYNDKMDISIVFSCRCVVTAWLNDKRDTHNTLDNSRYFKKNIYHK